MHDVQVEATLPWTQLLDARSRISIVASLEQSRRDQESNVRGQEPWWSAVHQERTMPITCR